MEMTKETFGIHTPEQVRFQYILAGLGTRATAFLLDTAIRALFVLCIVIAFLLPASWSPKIVPSDFLGGLSRAWLMALGVIAYGLVDLGYFLIFEALWSGQTPGKRQQKLRVIRTNGQPVGWLESSIRNIIRAVDIFLGFYPVGLIVMFLSKNNQRCGDYAAGTVVIVEGRRPVPIGSPRLRSAGRGSSMEIELHIGRLTGAQYQVLKSFLERKESLDLSHRRQLARTLVGHLSEQWKMSPSSTLSDEDFLEEIVMLYERRKRAL